MTFTPQSFTAWVEIPVSDFDKAVTFYNAVFATELKIDNTGPKPMAIFPIAEDSQGIAGNIYPGKPAPRGEGPTVHLTAPDGLEPTLERITAAGGEVISPAIEIPSGRFAYAYDPDGNSIGVFEAMAADIRAA